MSIGKDTFGLNKTEFGQKFGRIIQNFRAGSKLIGEPREFVLRACKLTEQWGKLAADPEVVVYLRNLDIAGGRKVKMVSLERGGTKQPVPKAKLLDALYPPKKIATTATPEEKHYNAVKAAMRQGIASQLKAFRDWVDGQVVCAITGKKIRPGMRTDVDHVGMTFSEIADSFVREKCLKYSAIVLCGPPTAKRFRDSELWEEWQEYHKQKARYSLVCASANRSKGSDGYIADKELLGSFAKEDPEDLSLDF
jgi:rhodanese-related sulfurtransferase